MTLARRWILGAAACFVVLVVLISIYLVKSWPYRGREVVPALAQTFSSTVKVGSYKRFYFPNPGFVAHNLVLRQHGSTNIPPLATVETLTATGSYLDFIVAPHHLKSLEIVGLHVQVAASGTPENGTKFLSGSSSPSTTIVDRITANQSVLDVSTGQAKPPMHFVIHTLTLKNVSSSQPMSYQVSFTNPIPSGEIVSQGRLGPLKRNDLGSTPLSGNTALTGSNLDVFHGVAGKLQAHTSFHGLLSRLDVNGSTDVPDFSIGQGQPEPLTTSFHALVDGTSGDVTLQKIQAIAGQTKIDISGKIDHQQGWHFAASVPNGRVQDLLQLFAHDGAPLTGTATLQASAFVPRQHPNFLKALQLNGVFALTRLHFTQSRTQQTIDGFSQRASGTAPKKKLVNADAEAPIIAADLKAQDIVLRDGVAHFTGLLFTLPGVSANGIGTYNLLNKHINIAGALHMDSDLSDATTGFKSFLLKPIDPLFKKKHGTVAPVHLSGTYDHPIVGLRLPSDRNHAARK